MARPLNVSANQHSRVFGWLVRHWLCAFLLMGAAFFVFGVASLNLVQLFTSNIGFILMHGADAISDGALMQFAELIFNATLATFFYLVFKICEQALVQRISFQQRKDS